MVGYYLQDKQPTFHISQAMMGKYWDKICECVFINAASSFTLSGLVPGNLPSSMKPWWMLSCQCSQLFKQCMPLILPTPAHYLSSSGYSTGSLGTHLILIAAPHLQLFYNYSLTRFFFNNWKWNVCIFHWPVLMCIAQFLDSQLERCLPCLDYNKTKSLCFVLLKWPQN